jgi:hypothetical protein
MEEFHQDLWEGVGEVADLEHIVFSYIPFMVRVNSTMIWEEELERWQV